MGLFNRRVPASILRAIGALALLSPAASPLAHGAHLDQHLQARAKGRAGFVEVIVTTRGPALEADSGLVSALGGESGPPFSILNGFQARVPTAALAALARSPRFEAISYDAPLQAFWDTNSSPASVGAREAAALYGVSGAGVGVAVIDSGSNAHADLQGRVAIAVEFFEDRYGQPVTSESGSPYDKYGHGTHVAGLVAGSGRVVGDFGGVAPGARLVILKALGSSGTGKVSRVLRAIDWVAQNAARHNVRVVNLSLGHPVYESYRTDPLCVALDGLVRRGIVVVAAAGNYGRSSDGTALYGGVVSPGHSPSVITVGAMNPRGTSARADDVMATFSSRGPTAVDGLVKPDVVAPGVFAVSLQASGSAFMVQHPDLALDSQTYGAPKGADDYYVLSGTSMAAPVVSGIVALMLEKNPALTPNLVKGILQYTAEDRGYDIMTQGAGYVNAPGAVEAAARITPSPELLADGVYWLSAPLSGGSTIAGEAVLWNGRVCWGSAVLWGGVGAIAYNLDKLWDLGVIWGGITAFDSPTLASSGVATEGVIWTGVPAGAQAVIWSGLRMEDVLYGEADIPGAGREGE